MPEQLASSARSVAAGAAQALRTYLPATSFQNSVALLSLMNSSPVSESVSLTLVADCRYSGGRSRRGEHESSSPGYRTI
jgi:hypothetical protein